MKRFVHSFLLLALAACTPGAQTSTAPPTDQSAAATNTEQLPTVSLKALRVRANQLSAAYVAKRFDTVLASLPPSYLSILERESRLSQEQYRAAYIKRHLNGSTDASLSSMTISVNDSALRQGEDGTIYALFPTERRLASPANRNTTFLGSTLAVQENGNWYLLVLDLPPQLKTMQRAFPDLRGVKWPGLRIERSQ